MNLSHVITEFSFGPFFPEIVQPLDNSYESTDKRKFSMFRYRHVSKLISTQILLPISTSFTSSQPHISPPAAPHSIQPNMA